MFLRMMLGAAMTVVAVTGPVAAQDTLAFACPKPGTVIEIGTTKHTYAGKGEGFLCGFVDANGAAKGRYAGVMAEESTFMKSGGAVVKDLWPLKVGNKASFQVSSGNYVGFETYTVKLHDKITVSAGTFDAWLIEWEDTNTQGTFRSVGKIWYASEVSAPVKFEYQVTAGTARSPPAPWQATKITMP
jgi:hypothetical protein